VRKAAQAVNDPGCRDDSCDKLEAVAAAMLRSSAPASKTTGTQTAEHSERVDGEPRLGEECELGERRAYGSVEGGGGGRHWNDEDEDEDDDDNGEEEMENKLGTARKELGIRGPKLALKTSQGSKIPQIVVSRDVEGLDAAESIPSLGKRLTCKDQESQYHRQQQRLSQLQDQQKLYLEESYTKRNLNMHEHRGFNDEVDYDDAEVNKDYLQATEPWRRRYSSAENVIPERKAAFREPTSSSSFRSVRPGRDAKPPDNEPIGSPFTRTRARHEYNIAPGPYKPSQNSKIQAHNGHKEHQKVSTCVIGYLHTNSESKRSSGQVSNPKASMESQSDEVVNRNGRHTPTTSLAPPSSPAAKSQHLTRVFPQMVRTSELERTHGRRRAASSNDSNHRYLRRQLSQNKKFHTDQSRENCDNDTGDMEEDILELETISLSENEMDNLDNLDNLDGNAVCHNSSTSDEDHALARQPLAGRRTRSVSTLSAASCPSPRYHCSQNESVVPRAIMHDDYETHRRSFKQPSTLTRQDERISSTNSKFDDEEIGITPAAPTETKVSYRRNHSYRHQPLHNDDTYIYGATRGARLVGRQPQHPGVSLRRRRFRTPLHAPVPLNDDVQLHPPLSDSYDQDFIEDPDFSSPGTSASTLPARFDYDLVPPEQQANITEKKSKKVQESATETELVEHVRQDDCGEWSSLPTPQPSEEKHYLRLGRRVIAHAPLPSYQSVEDIHLDKDDYENDDPNSSTNQQQALRSSSRPNFLCTYSRDEQSVASVFTSKSRLCTGIGTSTTSNLKNGPASPIRHLQTRSLRQMPENILASPTRLVGIRRSTSAASSREFSSHSHKSPVGSGASAFFSVNTSPRSHVVPSPRRQYRHSSDVLSSDSTLSASVAHSLFVVAPPVSSASRRNKLTHFEPSSPRVPDLAQTHQPSSSLMEDVREGLTASRPRGLPSSLASPQIARSSYGGMTNPASQNPSPLQSPGSRLPQSSALSPSSQSFSISKRKSLGKTQPSFFADSNEHVPQPPPPREMISQRTVDFDRNPTLPTRRIQRWQHQNNDSCTQYTDLSSTVADSSGVRKTLSTRRDNVFHDTDSLLLNLKARPEISPDANDGLLPFSSKTSSLRRRYTLDNSKQFAEAPQVAHDTYITSTRSLDPAPAAS